MLLVVRLLWGRGVSFTLFTLILHRAGVPDATGLLPLSQTILSCDHREGGSCDTKSHPALQLCPPHVPSQRAARRRSTQFPIVSNSLGPMFSPGSCRQGRTGRHTACSQPHSMLAPTTNILLTLVEGLVSVSAGNHHCK